MVANRRAKSKVTLILKDRHQVLSVICGNFWPIRYRLIAFPANNVLYADLPINEINIGGIGHFVCFMRNVGEDTTAYF